MLVVYKGYSNKISKSNVPIDKRNYAFLRSFFALLGKIAERRDGWGMVMELFTVVLCRENVQSKGSAKVRDHKREQKKLSLRSYC